MLAASLTAWVLAGPPSVDADPSASLVWEAPAECPDIEQVRQRIDGLAPGMLEQARGRIEARIERVDERFEATIHIQNQAGESSRQFAGSECKLVADAAALVIAVTLAPIETASHLASHAPAAPPTQVPSEREEAAPIPSEPSKQIGAPTLERAPAPSDDDDGSSFALTLAPRDEAPPSSRVRVALRASGGAAYGPTNTAYGSIGGALALFAPGWRVELAGSWSIPREVRRADVGGTFTGWAITTKGCYVPSWRRLEFPLCPGVELGQVQGRGLDELPLVQDASYLWVALGLGQGLWFALHERFALGVEARMAVPLRRGAFVVDDRQVQRMVAVAITGLAGVELRLP